MNGRTICVYGTVQNIRSTRETLTRIEFTDQPNIFFIYSTNLTFADATTGKALSTGDCVQVKGTVLLIGHVPYIDIADQGLYHCNP